MDISSLAYAAQDFGIFDTTSHIQQPVSGSAPGSGDSQRKGHIQLELGNYLCPKTIVVGSKEDPMQ